MILHRVNLEYKDRIRLRGIGDVHLGARACEEKRLQRDIQEVLSERDSYVILMGDVMEAITRQDLRRFQASSVKPEMLWELEGLLNAQLRLAIDTFKPLADKGRIIGALSGNHEEAVLKHHSFDIHREFCERLGIKNLGYSTMLRMTLKKRGEDRGGNNVVLFAHHGHGGGRKSGASLNRMEDTSADFAAHIYMMGHNHRSHASIRTQLQLNTSGSPRLVEKEMAFVRTGTYLKTWQEGPVTYSEQAGFPPTRIGSIPYVDISFPGQHRDMKLKVTQ